MKTLPFKDGDAAIRSQFAERFKRENGQHNEAQSAAAFIGIPVAGMTGNSKFHYVSDYPLYAKNVEVLINKRNVKLKKPSKAELISRIEALESQMADLTQPKTVFGLRSA